MSLKSFLPKSIRVKLRYYKAAGGRALFHLLWVFPIDKNKIVFSNFNGKGYGDNPKYIAEELLKRGWGNLYWLSKENDQNYPEKIKVLKYGSLISFYHIATACLWVDNNRKEPYIVKRKEQFYLQTWHGSIALKKIEKDAGDTVDDFYKTNAIRDSGMIDLMISDSAFSDQIYRKSFWYSGEVKRLGTPRFDCLYDKTNCDRIKAEIGIQPEQYVVLYAPTFRNNSDTSVYDIDLNAVKKAFAEITGKQVKILVKMHPHIPKGYINYDEGVAKDVSFYPDVYNLMKVSDALITDYSSLLFEFAIVEPKPVFSYAKDVDNYDRGFYFKLDKLPFLFARTNEELVKGIYSFKQDEYEQMLKGFYNEIDLSTDGKASERVVDYLLEQIGNDL